MPKYNPRQIEREQAEARAAKQAEYETTAHLSRHAISQCQLCDADGYRGTRVCDHQDHAEAARKGREACMQALAKEDEGDA